MDRAGLRAVQAPLKDRYRADAEAALVTLHAQGVLGEQEVSCSVETGRALVNAGLHPASGGDLSHACSGDMLLQALVACAGVTLQSVAINRGITVTGRVLAEGDLDFRGIMGVDREVPVGFTAIRLTFDVESDADAEALDSVIATTERYCVVLQTLRQSPPVEVKRR
ncbi:MAG: OsmC family protein [Candidatus Dormibacteraeota bacterium]|nr:OsmC family protein [Candidatus Dormibacteraeota bacterium]